MSLRITAPPPLHAPALLLLALSSLSPLSALANPSPSPAAPDTSSATTRPVESRTDWIDESTGHRVLRLSEQPGTASLYFHQNAYTDRGDKMLVTLPDGLATIDLTTLGKSPCRIERIAEGAAGSPIVGRKSRTAFYFRDGAILATHLDTHETREVCKLPQGFAGASGLALNSDETLLASTGNDPAARAIVATQPAPPRSELTNPRAGGRGEGGRSMALFTVEVKTGAFHEVFYSTSWLNHTQFSPTDPKQLLFCHEGDWHRVDRVWTLRLDAPDSADLHSLKLMHYRTMEHEIAGHEFFGFDGRWIWYDLQTPRSDKFWLGGVNLQTGERRRYPLERSWWSVHYNQSHDGKRFSGDGGGPNSVANRTPMPESKPLDPPGNGMWVYLFTPQEVPDEKMQVGGEAVTIGRLSAEKLVDLSKHDYRLEPNCTFSPDNRWIIFRSNMSGASQVYAVDLAKTK